MSYFATENLDPDFEKQALVELKKLMKLPAYWRDRDPEIVKAVSRGFEFLYDTPANDTDLPEARMGQLANILGLNGVENKKDTKIAHLTPGEIVIPLNYQTPSLMRAIRTALGNDLATYTVGSGHEQINPESGLPAFAGKYIEKCNELQKKYVAKEQLHHKYEVKYANALNVGDENAAGQWRDNMNRTRDQIIEIVDEQKQYGCRLGRIPKFE